MMRQFNCYECKIGIFDLKEDTVEATVGLIEKSHLAICDSMCNAMHVVHRSSFLVSFEQSHSAFSPKSCEILNVLLGLTVWHII